MKKSTLLLTALLLTAAAFGQKTETRTVSEFTGIDASNIFHITVKKGRAEALTITTDEDLMAYVKSEVKNGILRLHLDKGKDRKLRHLFNDVDPIKVEIVMKDLTSVDLSGTCRLQSADTFEPANFRCSASGVSAVTLQLKTGKAEFDMSGATKGNLNTHAKKAVFDISGAARLDLELESETVDFDISGASKITVKGKVSHTVIDASGACKIDAGQLLTREAHVDLSGTSAADVNASEELSIDVSGMSRVNYKGSPVIRSIESSGMSKIKRID